MDSSERTEEQRDPRSPDPFGTPPWAGPGTPADEPAGDPGPGGDAEPAEDETPSEPAQAEDESPSEPAQETESTGEQGPPEPTDAEATPDAAGVGEPSSEHEEPAFGPREPAFQPEPEPGLLERRPEIVVGAAAAGGFALAQILKRLGHG